MKVTVKEPNVLKTYFTQIEYDEHILECIIAETYTTDPENYSVEVGEIEWTTQEPANKLSIEEEVEKYILDNWSELKQCT